MAEAPPGAILLADDGWLVCAGTAAMPEDLGHCVFEANSAIDLVITDYAMPGISGIERAERIGALHPEMKIVLATGYA